MTDRAKLERDIQTLRESMRFDHDDLKRLGLSEKDRRALIKHLKWCGLELNGLIIMLESLEDHDA